MTQKMRSRGQRGRSIYRTTQEMEPSDQPTIKISKKVPKTKPAPNPKGKFIIHSNHSDIVEALGISKHHHTIISVDPGMKNYGFRIEKRYNSIYGPYNLSIDTIEMVKMKFDDTRSHVSHQGTKSHLFRDLFQFLDQYKEHYIDGSMAIIESQMTKNGDMSRVFQATIDYFLVRHPQMIVVELDAHLKSKALNAPSKMSKPELKKWDVEMAEKLLNARGDDLGLKILGDYVKKDDLADTIIGIEALVSHLKFQTTNPEGVVIPVIL
ncbi:Hypothetical protein POVR1_LOCUS435 [uncultured virus]|nr:Hypothetical protein POVR1_LOCUS435 [uncultured virus]